MRHGRIASRDGGRAGRSQGGVVLVVCLVVLLVLSLTAAVSVRGSASSEAIAGHARTQAMALQAAEAALLYCERQVLQYMAAAVPAQGTEGTTGADDASAPGLAPAEPLPDGQFRWQQAASWEADGPAPWVRVPFVPAGASGARASVQRPPECMAEVYDAGRPDSFVVTARGWGPEVAASTSAAPDAEGTELRLQTVVLAGRDASGRPVVASRWWRQIHSALD